MPQAHAHMHMDILTIQKLIYTQFETDSKQRLETDEDSSTEWKLTTTTNICQYTCYNYIWIIIKNLKENEAQGTRAETTHKGVK